MANQPNIMIGLLTESKDALKGINDFAKNASKELSTIEKAANKLNLAFAAVVSGFSVGAIVSGLKSAAGEAIEAEENFNQLTAALKLSGDFSNEARDSMVAFASELQRTTTISDDAAIKQLALAKNFGLTNEQAVKAVKAAADLSAATGEDLASSVEKLSLSYSGQLGRLGKLVPATKGFTEEQLKAGAAVDLIAKRFGGAAASNANTFGGALGQLKNQANDLKESIGNLIIQNPVLVSGIKSITGFIARFTESITNNKDEIIGFVNGGLSVLANSFAFLVDVVRFAVKVFLTWQATIIEARQAITDFIAETGPLNKIFTGLAKGIAFVTAGLVDLIKLLLELPGVSSVFNELNVDVKKLTKGLDNAENSLFQFVEAGDFKELNKGLKETSQKQIGALVKGIEKTDDVLGGLAKTARKFGDEAANTTKNATKNYKVAAESIQNIDKTLKDKILGVGKQTLKFIIDFVALNFKSANIEENLGKAAYNLATAAVKGAKGAKDLIVQGGALALKSFAGIPPEVSGPLLDALSQGPEAVRASVQEFVTSIPVILENIILALPVLIEELIKGILLNLDDIAIGLVQALIRAVPELIKFFIFEFPKVVVQMVIELVKAVPLIIGEFIKYLIDGAGEFVNALVDFVKGLVGGGKSGGAADKIGVDGIPIIGGLVDAIGGFFGFADGGLVPGGAPFTDRVPAMLTPGERVLDRGTTEKLDQLLSQGGAAGGAQTITVNLVVGEQQLANVLLNLNRRGFRVA